MFGRQRQSARESASTPSPPPSLCYSALARYIAFAIFRSSEPETSKRSRKTLLSLFTFFALLRSRTRVGGLSKSLWIRIYTRLCAHNGEREPKSRRELYGEREVGLHYCQITKYCVSNNGFSAKLMKVGEERTGGGANFD